MDPWNTLERLARRQHGAVRREQAVRLGVPSSTWHWRTQGEWRVPVPGVAVAPWATSGPLLAASIAALACAPTGAVTGDTALALHGARVAFPDPPSAVIRHGHRGEAPRGVDVLRSRTLRPDDLVTARGIRVVTPARALLDLAVRQPIDVLRERLIDLRQQGIVRPDEVAERAGRARGMTGRPKLLRAVRDVTGTGADSVFTRMVEEALVAAGLPPDPFPAEVPVEGGRMLHPDITYAIRRVAIECDSLAFHGDQRAIDLDSRKHNAYTLARWTVLRVTWMRFQRDRGGFVREVRRALAERGPRKA
jgi:hypothetical protein